MIAMNPQCPTTAQVAEFKKRHPKGAKRTIYYDGKAIQGEITCYRLNHFWLEYGVYNPVHGFTQYFKD